MGKWESSDPMLWKNSPVKLLPLIAGMLEGASHPIKPNPITLKSFLSQSLSKLPKQERRKDETSHPTNVHYLIYSKETSFGESDYHVNFPPEALTCLKGFLAVTGDFTNPVHNNRK